MRRVPWLLCSALLLCSCPTGDPDEPPVPPGCGNGVVEAGEECDDGDANSDTAADACRTSCLLPACGDAVADTGEACDDGTPWGGDGCTPLCEAEDGQLEYEPNDSPDEARDWTGEPIHGALPDGDLDCFAFDLPDCAAVEARLLGPCPAPATLTLYDGEGDAVAVGTPADDGCAVLDPAEAPGARFVADGRFAVCVEGLLDAPVPFYVLAIAPVDPEDATYTLDDADDPDGDGKPDHCDDDRDGDGVDNDEDNCPDTPNSGDATPLTPSADGFVRVWLGAGPYTGTDSTEDCRPSDDPLVADDDAAAAPALGDAAGDQVWTVLWSDGDRIEFLDDYGDVDAPREVYTAVYLRSDTARTLTLAIGPDDGARTWFNGVEVQDISGCQGTTIDQFQVDVDVLEGWNRLLIKVRDQGGGWGNYVRFLDGETPVTDLELSLDPAGPWTPDQTDSDGDGTGDVCDDTP